MSDDVSFEIMEGREAMAHGHAAAQIGKLALQMAASLLPDRPEEVPEAALSILGNALAALIGGMAMSTDDPLGCHADCIRAIAGRLDRNTDRVRAAMARRTQ